MADKKKQKQEETDFEDAPKSKRQEIKEDEKEKMKETDTNETKNNDRQEDEKTKEKQEIEELTQLVKRVQADFENYKKRVERDKAEFTRYASKKVIIELLHVLDHFDLALKHKENKEEFIKAMEMIHAEIQKLLEKEGVKTIEAHGQKFDPYRHEALMQETKDDAEDNIITEEFQKGYTMHDEVIRPTKVKVNKRR